MTKSNWKLNEIWFEFYESWAGSFRSCRVGSTAGASKHPRLWETERHVAAARKRSHQRCLTLDPKQYWNSWKNDMSLFSATNQERPYEQLLHNRTEPRIYRKGGGWGWESSFSLKTRPILTPTSAIVNNGVTIRDLIARDERTRGRGKRKVSTTDFKGGYVKTRCLRNQRFLSSDEYCVKDANEEKRKQRNIMARFIESWGLRGSVSSFSLHLPLHSSFHGCSLSPTFAQ